MNRSHLMVVSAISAGLVLGGCSSARKERDRARDSANATAKSGFFCSRVNDEGEYSQLMRDLVVGLAEHCDSARPHSVTSYIQNSEDRGLIYCCSRAVEKATEASTEAHDGAKAGSARGAGASDALPILELPAETAPAKPSAKPSAKPNSAAKKAGTSAPAIRPTWSQPTSAAPPAPTGTAGASKSASPKPVTSPSGTPGTAPNPPSSPSGAKPPTTPSAPAPGGIDTAP